MAVNNSLQKSQKRLGIGSYLTGDAVKQRINQVIGGKDGQRFISAVVSAVQTNPALQECTNQSILSAALLGESLKLSPSPQLGQYYMVPFNDKERGKVAQFLLGYPAFADANFKLVIYGAVTNPAITIGGHVYQVNCTVAAGEYLTIDSLTKKIFLTGSGGAVTNKFNDRNRDSYIFEKIPAGANAVAWSGSFGFDVTIYEERSEPKWT